MHISDRIGVHVMSIKEHYHKEGIKFDKSMPKKHRDMMEANLTSDNPTLAEQVEAISKIVKKGLFGLLGTNEKSLKDAQEVANSFYREYGIQGNSPEVLPLLAQHPQLFSTELVNNVLNNSEENISSLPKKAIESYYKEQKETVKTYKSHYSSKEIYKARLKDVAESERKTMERYSSDAQKPAIPAAEVPDASCGGGGGARTSVTTTLKTAQDMGANAAGPSVDVAKNMPKGLS